MNCLQDNSWREKSHLQQMKQIWPYKKDEITSCIEQPQIPKFGVYKSNRMTETNKSSMLIICDTSQEKVSRPCTVYIPTYMPYNDIVPVKCYKIERSSLHITLLIITKHAKDNE